MFYYFQSRHCIDNSGLENRLTAVKEEEVGGWVRRVKGLSKEKIKRKKKGLWTQTTGWYLPGRKGLEGGR